MAREKILEFLNEQNICAFDIAMEWKFKRMYRVLFKNYFESETNDTEFL